MTIGARLLLAVLIVATIGCDRVTKHMAATTLEGSAPTSLLAGTVRLHYAENTGGFLGVGADLPVAARTALFTVITGVALLGLGAMAIRLRRQAWPFIGLSLFVAGGTSNWVDRVTDGRVIDFIVVGLGPVRTGVFNVADVAIMIGAGLFIVSQTRGRQKRAPVA